MSNPIANRPDHDDIVSLLPWYVNQTLDADQRNAVSRHIEQCDDCQHEIRFLERLNETVRSEAQKGHTSHADVDKDFASVMNRIEADSSQDNAVTAGASALQQAIGSILRFSQSLSFPQWSATAVAGVLVAILGVQMFGGQSSDDYTVLSSSDAGSSPMQLIVETNSSVSQEQLQSLVQDKANSLEQQITIEPASNGAYTIVFSDYVGVEELGRLIADLEGEAQISRVEMLP